MNDSKRFFGGLPIGQIDRLQNCIVPKSQQHNLKGGDGDTQNQDYIGIVDLVDG